MATVREIAAQTAKGMISMSYLFVALAVSHFGSLVLSLSVPGNCLSFTFYSK